MVSESPVPQAALDAFKQAVISLGFMYPQVVFKIYNKHVHTAKGHVEFAAHFNGRLVCASRQIPDVACVAANIDVLIETLDVLSSLLTALALFAEKHANGFSTI